MTQMDRGMIGSKSQYYGLAPLVDHAGTSFSCMSYSTLLNSHNESFRLHEVASVNSFSSPS